MRDYTRADVGRVAPLVVREAWEDVSRSTCSLALSRRSAQGHGQGGCRERSLVCVDALSASSAWTTSKSLARRCGMPRPVVGGAKGFKTGLRTSRHPSRHWLLLR